MYINFHYFSVKTLCIEAGFSEDDAQCIAAYSQFVDDYDVWINYNFKIVPDFAKSLTKKRYFETYDFYTVTTGFVTLPDMGRLLRSKYQRQIVVPFHLIPMKKLNEISSEYSPHYRTAPADLTGTSLIKNLLFDAKDKYIKNKEKCNLIRIGLLLHIFADTYAHQMFSGLHSWENYSYLTKATNELNGGTDVRYKFEPDKYCKYPAIGHTDITFAYNAFSPVAIIA